MAALIFWLFVSAASILGHALIAERVHEFDYSSTFLEFTTYSQVEAYIVRVIIGE